MGDGSRSRRVREAPAPISASRPICSASLPGSSALPVPAVHVAEPDLLAMDFIETDGGGITPHVERHAAELIAALHATPRPFFGYERDTLIGPLPQPNPRSERWIPFFARAPASRHGAGGGS